MRLFSVGLGALALAALGVVVQAAPKTYDNPRFQGYGVNTCLDDAKSACGQAAAAKFCQMQQCDSAASFVVQDVSGGPTYQLGDNKVKSPGAGGSFSSITCECAAIGQRFDDPRVDGKPVDFCLRKQGDGGADCGAPAALAFCQAMGFTKAPSFLIRPDFPEETMFLRDRLAHTSTSRAGWQYIECGN